MAGRTQAVKAAREAVMADRLVWEALASDETALVDETLALNPGLAAVLAREGHVLPLDRALTLPERRPQRAPEVATVKLWD